MAKTTARKAAKVAAPQSKEETGSELRKFFIDEIKDIYWAEKHLTKALGQMQKAATSPELGEAFGTHLNQTQEHVSRLEKVFEMLGEEARGKKCDAMAGLVDEAKSIIDDTEDGTATRDVGLILAAQKVEHYEIATYGGLCSLAKTLGMDEVKEVLGETLNEEKETDELLSDIAENNINLEATEEPVS
jgi:ferritin-like metal-binding protein YciE